MYVKPLQARNVTYSNSVRSPVSSAVGFFRSSSLRSQFLGSFHWIHALSSSLAGLRRPLCAEFPPEASFFGPAAAFYAQTGEALFRFFKGHLAAACGRYTIEPLAHFVSAVYGTSYGK